MCSSDGATSLQSASHSLIRLSVIFGRTFLAFVNKSAAGSSYRRHLGGVSASTATRWPSPSRGGTRGSSHRLNVVGSRAVGRARRIKEEDEDFYRARSPVYMPRARGLPSRPPFADPDHLEGPTPGARVGDKSTRGPRRGYSPAPSNPFAVAGSCRWQLRNSQFPTPTNRVTQSRNYRANERARANRGTPSRRGRRSIGGGR